MVSDPLADTFTGDNNHILSPNTVYDEFIVPNQRAGGAWIKNTLGHMDQVWNKHYTAVVKNSGKSGDAGSGTMDPDKAIAKMKNNNVLPPELIDALCKYQTVKERQRHREKPTDTGVGGFMEGTCSGASVAHCMLSSLVLSVAAFANGVLPHCWHDSLFTKLWNHCPQGP